MTSSAHSSLVELSVFFHGLAAVSLSVLTIYCLNFRHRAPARALAAFLGFSAMWAVLSILIFWASDLETKILLNRIKMLAVIWIPPSIFAVYASLLKKPLPRWSWPLLFAVPALNTLCALSPWHSLLITDYRMLSLFGREILAFGDGPAFLIHGLFSRGLVLATLILLLWPIEISHRHHKVSRAWIFFALIIPFLGDSLSVLVFTPLRYLQITPTLLAITGVLMTVAIFRYRVHETVPFARNIIIEHSPDLVVITSPENKILDFNRSAAGVFGLSVHSLHRPFPDLPHSFAFDQRSEFKHGEKIYEVQPQRIHDHDVPMGTIWNFKDITLQRIVIKELASINQIKSLILGVMGHDLHTHLAGLSLEAEDLMKHVEQYEKEDIQAGSESIHLGTRSCIEFVNQVLAWSKQQLNTSKPQFQTVELGPVVHQCISLLTSQLARKNLEVDVDPAEICYESWTDPFLVGTILRNLLSNAIKFSPPSARIQIRLEQIGSAIQVQVGDSGAGMSEDELEEILEAGRPRNSQGLGLLICRDFIRVLGGELSVKSRRGQGSVFSFSLPNATASPSPSP